VYTQVVNSFRAGSLAPNLEGGGRQNSSIVPLYSSSEEATVPRKVARLAMFSVLHSSHAQSHRNSCPTVKRSSLWGSALAKKGAALYESMLEHQSGNIRRISADWPEQMAYYRFLENAQVTPSELSRTLSSHCQQQVGGKHVLAISDTTEINLQSHLGRLKSEGLGVVGNNTDVGFFLHPTLVLDAETGFPLGLSAVQLWTREANRPSKAARKYSRLPIEQKESYKWVASAERSTQSLMGGGATQVTHIGDRESDIYEAWHTIPEDDQQLLVRVQKDRVLAQGKASLYELLAQQPVEGTYEVEILADARLGRRARKAWLAVRFTAVEIQRPANLSAHDYPASKQLWAVEAREILPPPDQEPVHWRLLTTHRVESVERALQILLWYRWRWRIEQLFGTIKIDGLDLESSQLESIQAIQCLTVLGLSVALRILQFVVGRDHPELDASVALTPEQQTCLRSLAPTLSGRTKKQLNPHRPLSLAWAVWLVARLGGWSGYQSQRPPGVLTLVQGWRRFEAIFLGWNLTQT
jgi:Transposase DDE domain